MKLLSLPKPFVLETIYKVLNLMKIESFHYNFLNYLSHNKANCPMHYAYIEFTQYCIMSSEDASEIDDLERH